MQHFKSRFWRELSSADFAHIDSEATVALLPVAAIEQHGPHLPLATDALINAAIVEAALPKLAASSMILVLPALDIGLSLEHTEFAGTLSIADGPLTETWLDVGRSVARAGVRKLVIFNSHGGQTALVDLVALKLRAELGLLVVRANYMRFGAPAGLFSAAELAHGLHGGEVETSLMLHIRPELVRREALQDFVGLPAGLAAKHEMLGVERPAGLGWMGQDLHSEGVCGNALGADAERGERYLSYLADKLAVLLAEVEQVPLGIIGEP